MRLALLLLSVVLLAACGHARVVKREGGAAPSRPAASAPARPPAPARGEYVVRQGDTMYGIAFRHGLDYRDLAGWNRIAAPYTIYPGQRLRLQPPGRGPVVAAGPAPRPAGSVTGMPAPARAPVFETVETPRPAPTAAGPAPAPASSAGTAPPSVAAGTPPAPLPSSPAAPAATPAATPAIAAASPPPAATPASPAAPAPAAPTPAAAPGADAGPASAAGWRWPTRGQVISRFAAGDPSRQGLAIAGTAGQPVHASADGVVVYSGAGLVGYGELVIIKHSDEWLSAYAHNRRRLVAEGQAVKGGQVIAELGRTGTSRDMLHFEIRRNGKPVDPLPLLPGR